MLGIALSLAFAMFHHPLMAVILIALVTISGFTAIRYLFPRSARSPSQKMPSRRHRSRLKLPLRF